MLRFAASLDQVSPHVMAGAIVAGHGRAALSSPCRTGSRNRREIGIEGMVEGRRVRLGRAWIGCSVRRRRPGRSNCCGGRVVTAVRPCWWRWTASPIGALLLADEIRRDTPRALRALRRAGIGKVVMLSGDRQDVAEMVAGALGVDSVLAERSPQDKVDAVRAERADQVTVMVGDGINDAPALAAADVGVAMGARGAGAASEAADVVLLVDRLDRLAVAIQISRRARRIALESVLAGMVLSMAGMMAAARAICRPWPARCARR